MLNKAAKLNKNVLSPRVDQHALRDGFGEGVVIAGEKNDNVVILSADLTESTRSHHFRAAFPDRFFEIGVAEQNLATVAAGIAAAGKIAFISSYATFSPGRNWEQIRTTCCYNDTNVKIAGHHAGLTVGPDGATHQALEDITIMRALPNMKVFVPCDWLEAKRATIAAAHINGPVYIRLARAKTPVITTSDTPFTPGHAYELWTPKTKTKLDVVIIGAGPILHEALLAAAKLEDDNLNVSVLNLHTIKPLDETTILRLAKRARAVVTLEEHQLSGGVGSAVAELLAQKYPVPIEMIGLRDTFGESGRPEQLVKKYGLDEASIIKAVRRVIKRK